MKNKTRTRSEQLAHLSAQIKRLGELGDFSARLDVSSAGEGEETARPLSELVSAINGLLDSWEQSQAGLRAQEQFAESMMLIAHAIAEHPSLEAMLHNTLAVVTTLTGAERGSLFVLDSAGAVIRWALSTGEMDKPGDAQQAAVIQLVMDKGVAGWVARHRQAALLGDTAQDERWLTLPNQAYVARSALAAPILRASTLVGVLTLLHPQIEHFNARQLYLVQAAADQIALAVRNAQNLEMQRRQASRQATLYQVLRTVSEQLDPDTAVQTAVEAIVEFAGWPHVAIVLPTPDHQHWEVRAGSGMLAKLVGTQSSIESGLIGRAFRSGRIQHVVEVSTDPDYIAAHADLRSEVTVPIRHGERILGVLDLESEQVGDFDDEDKLLAASLAEAIGLTLSNAELYAEARKYATDLSALYAIAQAISQALALEDIFSHALSLATSMLDFEAGLICLAEAGDSESEPAERLRLAAEYELSTEQLEAIQRQGLEDSLCAYVHERGQSVIIGDLEQTLAPEIAQLTSGLTTWGWRAYTGIPLLYQDRSLGTLSLLASRPRTPSAYELAMVATIGHQVAAAVASERLFRAISNEQGRLAALIESSRDGVLLVGLDQRVLVLNAPAMKLMGLAGKPERWLGRPLREALDEVHLHAPIVAETMMAEMSRIQDGDEPPTEGEYELFSRVVHWLNQPVLSDSVPVGRLVVLRDVTDERIVERRREDMTHTMVHDLRSPLSAIFTTVELLQEDTSDAFSPETALMMDIVRRNTHKMLALVNGILDVSRLESGQMPVKREPFGLGELAGEVLQTQSALAQEKGLHLDNHVPPTLPPAWADVELIRRVLQNLVGNAVKFTPPGGTICIESRLEEKEGLSKLLVSVTDSGGGIPSKLQGRVFEKFVAGEQKERGSGLGLAFCKLAIEAHGERIWIDNPPASLAEMRGARFTFSLATWKIDHE
ncbi:MAG: GAF domain-containing protein [Thermoflexales bacterium]|nr:GAF domain-containing protein [Thermoflexales bacterium]